MCIREKIAGVVVGHVLGKEVGKRMDFFLKETLTGVVGDDHIEHAPDVHFEERVKNFCVERGIALGDAYIMGLDIGASHTGTAVEKFLHLAELVRNWQIKHLNESGEPKNSHLFGNQFSNMCIREKIAGVVVGHLPGKEAGKIMDFFLKEILPDHWAR